MGRSVAPARLGRVDATMSRSAADAAVRRDIDEITHDARYHARSGSSIADDQPDIIDALRLLLIDEGYEVAPARSPGRGARARSRRRTSTWRSSI